ncbi:hypothetical protein FJZ36_16720 [Candidatus Poribacteria bacterium]|nr:hypothetical protein [Candidatus Poribacteria bacterium]
MRSHVAEMRATPFDGTVFHMMARQDDANTNFTWHSWGTEAYDAAAFAHVIDDLKATREADGFPHNFLRFNVTPGGVDWFDDFSAILHNAELAASVAKEGACDGLLFDIEQYNSPLFQYRGLRDAATKPWHVYADQATRRGVEVMEAFQAGFPDLKVFLTFGYCLPWYETRRGERELADVSYGLLAPFLDGMVSAARGGTKLVDGHESSYGYRDPAQFDAAYRTMSEELLPIVADPARYAEVFSLGFGLWLDHDWRRQGWDDTDISANYHQPEQFAACLRHALEVSDEYVWIYTETPRWWSPEGPVKLPAAYADAIRRTRS